MKKQEVLSQLASKSREIKKEKYKEWQFYEDEALKNLIQKFNEERINWNWVAKSMQNKFGDHIQRFNSKACRNRYNHYLKEGLNLSQLTEQEIEKLISLTKVHGNQWSNISKEMSNRTEQFVKNTFYAFVKKKLRKLYKLLTRQKNSSVITNQLKPHIISKFLCANQNDDLMTDEERQISMFAQELVFDIKINNNKQLDQLSKDKLLVVMNFLKMENLKYCQRNKRVPNKFCKNKDDFRFFSTSEFQNQINPQFAQIQNNNFSESCVQQTPKDYLVGSTKHYESLNQGQENTPNIQISSLSDLIISSPIPQVYSNYQYSLSFLPK